MGRIKNFRVKIIDGRKMCTKCQKFLPLDQFYKWPHVRLGYKYHCKECERSEMKQKLLCTKCGKEFIGYKRTVNNATCKECKIYTSIENLGDYKKRIRPPGYWKNYKKYLTKKPKYIFLSLGRNRKHNVLFTEKEFCDWYERQEKKCCYCHLPSEYVEMNLLNHGKQVRLTIDRMDSSKQYEINNIVLACRGCNSIKTNILSHDEMLDIGQKYIKPKWQNKLREVSQNVITP